MHALYFVCEFPRFGSPWLLPDAMPAMECRKPYAREYDATILHSRPSLNLIIALFYLFLPFCFAGLLR